MNACIMYISQSKVRGLRDCKEICENLNNLNCHPISFEKLRQQREVLC